MDENKSIEDLTLFVFYQIRGYDTENHHDSDSDSPPSDTGDVDNDVF